MLDAVVTREEKWKKRHLQRPPLPKRGRFCYRIRGEHTEVNVTMADQGTVLDLKAEQGRLSQNEQEQTEVKEIMEPASEQRQSQPLEPARVDADLDDATVADQKPSTASSVCKCVTVTVMSLAFLASLIFSKLSLFHIGTDLMEALVSNNNRSNATVENRTDETENGSSRAETDFLMLLLIMLIPYGITFFRALWCGGFRSDKPWPCWKAIGVVS